MLNVIRNSEKDLPIENTIAAFLFQPNRLSILQSKVTNIIKTKNINNNDLEKLQKPNLCGQRSY